MFTLKIRIERPSLNRVNTSSACSVTRVNTFRGLFLGSNQYWARKGYGLCMYFMIGAPDGSTESGSGEAGHRTFDTWFTRHA